MKILAIDDNRDNLTVLSAVVLDHLPTAQLLTALDGAHGLAVARTEDPDVILLDIVMPDMDGYTVCRTLKADARLHTIPVLFLTATRTDRQSRIKALEVGAEGFLSKPFDEIELTAQIQAMAKIKAANRSQLREKEQLAALVAERTRELEQELAERKRAEDNYRTLFREMLDGFALHEILCDEQGRPIDYRFLAINPAFERQTGLKAETLVGRTILEVMPGTERHWIETYGRVALTGEPAFFENYSAALHKHFEVTAFRPAPRQFACIFSDISERKQAEADKAQLEGQLQQAQKMESVGRLAGGVAHDFNNMLQAILGHVDLALEHILPNSPARESLDEIRTAAERSADLTQQLLAFARKQIVAPKVLDLNKTVAGILKMLKRLIGEDIQLVWQPQEELWPVRLDPTQIDQVLANLCVNARDAIADVGTITITTANSSVPAAACAAHAGCAPGEYVQLTISDTGCGMDQDMLVHIFEPFFTTKEMGKGTGLGLATVYGVVQQNNGFITVASESGHGTTFTIYLPRYAGTITESLPHAEPESSQPGRETVLLVEDEQTILKLTTHMLEKKGYIVLPASTPGQAIRLAREYAGDIHLLMTDVVMPEMNGRDLAKNLLPLYPRLKRLFMSGYTSNVIAHHGALDDGVFFIQKPFSIKTLAAKVREVLTAQ